MSAENGLTLSEIKKPSKCLDEIEEGDIASFDPSVPRTDFVVLEDGRASIEVQGELVYALMTKQYEKARDLCQIILRVEPDHVMAKELHPVIVSRMEQLAEMAARGDDGEVHKWSSSSEDESDIDGSEGSSSDDSSSDDSDEESDEEEKILTHRVGDMTIQYKM